MGTINPVSYCEAGFLFMASIPIFKKSV